jgi:hypothetical protein
MKIDVSRILTDHLDTLRDVRSGKRSSVDLALFYLLPMAFGSIMYWRHLSLSNDVYNVSITFFGIFIALLLNIQVAVFGIFQRKWPKLGDDRLAEIQEETLSVRKQLLSEMNINISYLILISCFALVIFLLLFVIESRDSLSSSVTVFIYTHFLLTLLMVVKRSHALFQLEYKCDS